MAGPIFVDTWGWLALGHRWDAHHAEVKNIFESVHSRPQGIQTSDYVLDELISLLFRREKHAEAMRFVDGIVAEQVAGRVMWLNILAQPPRPERAEFPPRPRGTAARFRFAKAAEDG
jgi:predicted nucleic acid-binding protein